MLLIGPSSILPFGSGQLVGLAVGVRVGEGVTVALAVGVGEDGVQLGCEVRVGGAGVLAEVVTVAVACPDGTSAPLTGMQLASTSSSNRDMKIGCEARLDERMVFGLYSRCPGCSAVGQRTAFGTRGSAVQVRPPRLVKTAELQLGGFLIQSSRESKYAKV
jgi:hypothetical protein